MPVSPRTQEAYLACVRQWAEHFNTAPDLITAEQLRQYFIHLKLGGVVTDCLINHLEPARRSKHAEAFKPSSIALQTASVMASSERVTRVSLRMATIMAASSP